MREEVLKLMPMNANDKHILIFSRMHYTMYINQDSPEEQN